MNSAAICLAFSAVDAGSRSATTLSRFSFALLGAPLIRGRITRSVVLSQADSHSSTNGLSVEILKLA